MIHPSTLSWGTTLFLRILFALMVTALIMVGVLKLLERTGEPLRQGIERALADMTQSHVYLETLDDPKIFPHIHLTMKNIAVSDKDDATQRLASAAEIELSVPFVRSIFGFPTFQIFSLKNLRVEKDVLFPRALTIDAGGIEASGPTPVFALRGRVGDAPATLRLDIAQTGANPPAYRLSPDAPMTLTVGSMVIEGRLHATKTALMLEKAVLKGDGREYGPRDFFIVKNQQFVKDNPVSCLMGQTADSRLTDAHPCATLFERKTKEDQE